MHRQQLRILEITTSYSQPFHTIWPVPSFYAVSGGSDARVLLKDSWVYVRVIHFSTKFEFTLLVLNRELITFRLNIITAIGQVQVAVASWEKFIPLK